MKHIEQILNVDLGLLNLSEQGSHVEQWTCKLHEVSVNHDEVSGSQSSAADIVSRH
jgi:hypothetical protein